MYIYLIPLAFSQRCYHSSPARPPPPSPHYPLTQANPQPQPHPSSHTSPKSIPNSRNLPHLLLDLRCSKTIPLTHPPYPIPTHTTSRRANPNQGLPHFHPRISSEFPQKKRRAEPLLKISRGSLVDLTSSTHAWSLIADDTSPTQYHRWIIT